MNINSVRSDPQITPQIFALPQDSTPARTRKQ